MNTPSDHLVLPNWLRAWERFWFAPADPSLLGLIRIACGMITVYTLAVYSFNLQDFMGEHAWHDMTFRDKFRHERPVNTGIPLTPKGTLAPPKDDNDVRELDAFFARFGMDLRVNGLTPPQNEFQKQYAYEYTEKWKFPPPAYPRDEAEREAIDKYIKDFNSDPRLL